MTQEENAQTRALSNIHNVIGYDMSFETRMEHYDKFAETYDEDVTALEFKGPKITAETTADLFPGDRNNVQLLDVAAGTGLVGVELQNRGFTNIDALEPSKGMIEKARRRNVYRELFMLPITDKPLDVPDNSYDAVTISGGFGKDAAPFSSLKEMIRLVKPGGFIVIVTRQYFGHKDEYVKDFLPLIQQLEKEGKWKKIEMSACGFLNVVAGEKLVFGVL